ncbi:MAG: glutathione S-transferase family protein [Pseudomonadales bacterium]
MATTYTLYGSYASYYTAKVRAYLRKKGIPFVERLPSDPMFRNKVRPASGSHRIPQLLTPEGEVIQDSVEIVDYLEARFPDLPAFPDTPRQRTFVHLMELLGSEGLVRLAWLHRWLFEENDRFVKMDFGRSFKPQGSDQELQKYGNLIADRMRSYGLPESTPAAQEALDAKYCELLSLFEAHLIDHPYFLGGHPSAADYAVMGAMHAHLGRDPAGLRVMQDHAPRTFRWVEHMIVPEVASPEFFSRPVEYAADDQVPQTALDILNFIANEYGEQFVLGALAFNQAMERIGAATGYELAPDQDQPILPPEHVVYEGSEHEHSANLHAVWLTQRVQRYFQSQTTESQSGIETLLGPGLLSTLVNVPLQFSIERVNNRLAIQ